MIFHNFPGQLVPIFCHPLYDYLHQHGATCHFVFSARLLIEQVIYCRKKKLKLLGRICLLSLYSISVHQCPMVYVLKDILPTFWSELARCTVCPCDPLLNYLHRMKHSNHSEIGVTVCDSPVSPGDQCIKDKRQDPKWRALQKVLGSQWERQCKDFWKGSHENTNLSLQLCRKFYIRSVFQANRLVCLFVGLFPSVLCLIQIRQNLHKGDFCQVNEILQKCSEFQTSSNIIAL